MSRKYPHYGGLLIWNHMRKEVTICKKQEPLHYEFLFISKLMRDYPEYKVISWY